MALTYRFEEAAEKGISRAIEAGAKKPILCFNNPKEKAFPNAGAVSLLGALKAAYVPIEVRVQIGCIVTHRTVRGNEYTQYVYKRQPIRDRFED